MVDLQNIQINPSRKSWHFPPPLECISALTEYPECLISKESNETISKASVLSHPDFPKSFSHRFAPNDYEVPAHWIGYFDNARVFSHNGIIIDAKNRILEELTYEFKSVSLGSRICQYQGLPEPTHVKGRLLVIPSVSAWKNYWHWMGDSLPRLRHLSPDDYDWVLIPAFKSYALESALICGVPEHKILWADGASHYQADQIIAPKPTPMYCMGRESIDFLHHAYNIHPSPSPWRKLYLSRGDSRRRRWTNEEELIHFLKQYDYEIVLAGELSLKEQAQLFSEAISIVGPHGAAMSNAIFTPPGAHLVECFSGDFIYPHFYNLSAVRGFHYHGHYSPNDERAPDSAITLSTLKPIVEKIEQMIH